MIIHSISLSNWRSVLDRTDIGPFSEQINVIHAPNGSGKSSLFEAMRRALFDAHHVTGTEIEAVRPWGRELSPRVTLEFSESGDTYRVEKTFLSDSSATLSRLEDGAFKRIAEGRNADIRIREILAADAPGRGLSKQEHWGLAQILWAPQGELNLKSINPAQADTIRNALGVQISGESGGELENRIREHYLKFFTGSGKHKSGTNAAPIATLEQEHTNLLNDLTELREKQLDYEEASRKVEDTRNTRVQARREADGLRGSIAETRKLADEYRQLQADKVNKTEAETNARLRYENLIRIRDRIDELTKTIGLLESGIKANESLRGEIEAEHKKAGALLEKRQLELVAARKRRDKTSNLVKQIDDARQLVKDIETSQTLRKKVDKHKALESNLRVVREQRSSLIAPDSVTLRKIRSLIAKRDQSQASLSASQIHLKITPEKDITVEYAIEDRTEHGSPEKPVSLTGDALVEVRVKGFGQIRAAGPEGGSAEHREAIHKANDELVNLCKSYGNTDPDALVKLREQADTLEQSVRELEASIGNVLDGYSAEELSSELAESDARIASMQKTYPDWKKKPPVPTDLQTEYDITIKDINESLSKAEDAADSQRNAESALKERLIKLDSTIKSDIGNQTKAKVDLGELTKDGQTERERETAISDALMSWEACKITLKKIQDRLDTIPGDPIKDLEKLEGSFKAHEEREQQARDDEKTAEGVLQSLAANGTYSRLVAREEEVEELERRIALEKVRMEAIKLLYTTIHERKQAVVASVAAPLEKTATHMLRRIVGPRLGSIKMNQNFVPEAVHPDLASDRVTLGNLSCGEQEQLFLIVRLALAEVLAKEQRQLIVLDDVLNATDVGRLARLLNLLEEVSERLQIIILTCHPERYRALEQANFIDLTNS